MDFVAEACYNVNCFMFVCFQQNTVHYQQLFQLAFVLPEKPNTLHFKKHLVFTCPHTDFGV